VPPTCNDGSNQAGDDPLGLVEHAMKEIHALDLSVACVK
jgi:hypothetical protein